MLACRSRSWPSGTPRAGRACWTRATYAANALPGVVVGLALVFFAARYVNVLYGTLAVLIAAYVVRFLPQALVGTRRRSGASTRGSRTPRAAWAAASWRRCAP